MSVPTPERAQEDLLHWVNWLVHGLLPLCLSCEGIAATGHQLQLLPQITDCLTAAVAYDVVGEAVPQSARSAPIRDAVLQALGVTKLSDAANWRARHDLPAVLEDAGLTYDAGLLRALEPVRTVEAANEALKVVNQVGVNLIMATLRLVDEQDDGLVGTALDIAAMTVQETIRALENALAPLTDGVFLLRCAVVITTQDAATAAADAFWETDEALRQPAVALAARRWVAPFDDFAHAVEVIEGFDPPSRDFALLCLRGTGTARRVTRELARYLKSIEPWSTEKLANALEQAQRLRQ